MVAILGVYNRAELSAAAVTRKIEDGRVPAEVLQRIAEDLDGIIAGGDTKIKIDSSKFDNGYPTARMEIVKNYYDAKNKPQVFERIVWQSSFDYDSEAGGLVLYRGYSGIGTEDKLLDENKEDWERQLFVPICNGVSFFKIQVPKTQSSTEQLPIEPEFEDKWESAGLPLGVVVSISFAEPYKTVEGTLDVLDEEKISRAIAVDRTRGIKFVVTKKQDEEDDENKDEQSDGKEKGKTKESEDNKSADGNDVISKDANDLFNQKKQRR